MEREENKLFKFATKELSQDAFISWCINWFNYQEQVKGNKNKEKLCEMSKKILDKILENTSINSSKIEKINIVRQFEKIDITLTITLKNLKQYIVIIEDKIDSYLSIKQANDFYVTKLLNSINNKDKNKSEISRERLSIKEEITKNEIILVYWKTGKWEKEKSIKKVELQNNLKQAVICLDGLDTLNMLKEYINNSEIVEDYYKCLQDEMKINNVINQVDEIVQTQKIKIGTKFAKNYYCYNCFKNITKKEYTKNSHPQLGGLSLTNLNKKLKHKNLIHINTIMLSNPNKNWQNEFKDNNNLWVEKVASHLVEQGKLYTDIKYVFLFGKRRDQFGRNQFIFMGFYKLSKYDEKNNFRIWERQNKNETMVTIDEESIIKSIENERNKNR